jgi:NAD-dependent deacetylase
MEEVATPEGFRRDPKKVWRWYAERRKMMACVKPNPGHYVLAQLEREKPQLVIITQNIDGLHALAGSRKILELHGNIWQVRCTGCGRISDDRRLELPELPQCDHCGKLLRPHVVWFGEPLPLKVLAQAIQVSRNCDLMLVVGTSGTVYPAAALAWEAKFQGAKLVEVNTQSSALSSIADVFLQGKAGKLLPLLTA